ncbi:hypothetical protein [Stenotrophomonas lacuserhaii]|uniref:hypothetical protein n=1 Tax=Stenotrophomonas lacuserhaii TaxID=2760084 RepID=UPI0015FD6FDC|nr:hypothetical protein [Stenotrophomonas lacuserhaii]
MKLRKLKGTHTSLLGQAGPWIRSRWIGLSVVGVCVCMVLFAPVYALGNPAIKKSWVTIYQTPKLVDAAAPVPVGQAERPSSDEAFGRHLDTVTGFYGTVITMLTVMLGAVVSLAFFTVKASSRAEMERALRDVVDSEDFRAFLRAKIQAGVATGIENELGNVFDLVDELRGMYEQLDDIAIKSKSENVNGDS